MNAKRTKPDIDKVFADGSLIDEAIREGVHRALQEHKRAGNPVAVWRDGKVVMLKPEAIPA
jgi:hypothetical protein